MKRSTLNRSIDRRAAGRPVPVLVVLAALTACTGAPLSVAPLEPEHTFAPSDCGVVEGDARLTTDGQFETGVTDVAFALDPEAATLTYDLRDEDGEGLGRIVHRVRADGVLRPVLVAESTLTEGGVEVASQVSRYVAAPNRVRITTVTREGGREVRLEWAITAEGVVSYARLLRRDDAAPAGPDVVRRLDGTWRVLPIYDAGEALVAPDDATDFIAAAGLFGDDSTGQAWRLMRTSVDAGLVSALDARVQTCDDAQVAAGELALVGESSGSSAVSCDKGGGPLGDVLTISGGLMTVFDAGFGAPPLPAGLGGGFGASGLGLAYAIGTAAGVSTAGGALLAIAAGVGIAYAIGAVTESIVNNNADSIINGVGTAVLGADEGRSAAISEFYGRGGSSAGDPHLVTLDGERFDLQSAGELVLVRALSGSRFEVQSRQGPSEGACPGVAYNHAVAVAIGAHTFFMAGDGSTTLTVDGVVIDLLEGDVLRFDDGAAVFVDNPNTVALQGAEGDAVLLKRSAFVHLYLAWQSGRATEGALGNANGVIGDDFLLPPGVTPSFRAPAWTLRRRLPRQ